MSLRSYNSGICKCGDIIRTKRGHHHVGPMIVGVVCSNIGLGT